ncbi:MAG: hypothetical protein ACRDKF_16950 [Actinomycetota bacterium]
MTSSQADAGLGPDDVANDIKGWTTGTSDSSSELRAERYGRDEGVHDHLLGLRCGQQLGHLRHLDNR